MTDPFDVAAAAGHQLQADLAAAKQALAAETAKDQTDEATVAALQQQVAQLQAELNNKPGPPPGPPPPPQPKPQGVLCGVGPVNSAADLAAEEAGLGKVAIIRHYQQANEGITSEPFAWSGNRDVVSSSKVPPADIAAGKWDAQLTAKYRAAIAAGVRLYVCPWHEPEQELDAGQFTIADLTAAFTRMHALARQVDPAGQHIYTIHILMGYKLNQGQNIDKYMPTDLSVVDVLGWDPYQNSPTYETKPGALFAKVAAFSAAKGKPWAVCETGVNHLKFTGQAWYDNLTVLAREAATAGPPPVFVTYFDHNSRSAIDNIIRNDPKAVAAWKAGQAG